jgi:hypothetical protein
LVGSLARAINYSECVDKLTGKYYHILMKITAKLKGELMRELASQGGKARAKKYDKATLSKWAKKGGRPRKKAR